MLSPYETPEFRSLFNSQLKNVSGKKRIESIYKPVQVPEGIVQVGTYGDSRYAELDTESQTFVQFACNSHKDEADKRFDHFSGRVRHEYGVKRVQLIFFSRFSQPS